MEHLDLPGYRYLCRHRDSISTQVYTDAICGKYMGSGILALSDIDIAPLLVFSRVVLCLE